MTKSAPCATVIPISEKEETMTKEQYRSITQRARRMAARLPFGAKAFSIPTYLCAAIYLGMLGLLILRRDSRFFRAALVPASIFLLVTALRPALHRQRPYDAFGIPPVGDFEPNKGKSMPSSHAASAAAISFAVMWVFPTLPVIILMSALCLFISALRVFTGKHYPSDVIAALLLAGAISCLGYAV